MPARTSTPSRRGVAAVRRRHRHRRVLTNPTARASGPVSRRHLPRRCGRHLRRFREGQVRAAHLQQRFTALQSGEVDLLSNNTTWTLTRERARLRLHRRHLLRRPRGLHGEQEARREEAPERLNGATVCVAPGTTRLSLADYFRANKMTLQAGGHRKVDEVRAAFFSGRCGVYTTDASALATRVANAPKPETTSSCRRSSQGRWARWCARRQPVRRHHVRWTQYAMIEAEGTASRRRTSTR